VLPKVKSRRDAGDMPGRKNHEEEAKLWLLHTPRPRIVFPLHIKWRNKEGSCATRRQLPNCLGRCRPPGELSSTWQISIAPWTDWPPPREKRGKSNLYNKQVAEKKKTFSKEGRVPWTLESAGGGQSPL
jgi:hypothetical protein